MLRNVISSSGKSPLSYSLRFIVLMVLEVPAILVSLAVFAHFISCRALRKKRQQHSVFLLLFINFLQITFDIPMSLDYYRSGGIVRPTAAGYCTWWTFYDYSLFTTTAWLMAWISLERHLLIFHDDLLGGIHTWKKCIFHVGPWIACCGWGPLLYTIIVVSTLVCSNHWDFDAIYCGDPCFLSTIWAAVDVFADVAVPVLIISIANLTLILRVIHRRPPFVCRTRLYWRNQLKMVVQLSAISVTYLMIWLPVAIIQLIQLYTEPTLLSGLLDTFYFLAYIGPLLLPAICIRSIPQLWKRITVVWRRHRQVALVPMIPVFRKKQPLRQWSYGGGNEQGAREFPIQSRVFIKTLFISPRLSQPRFQTWSEWVRHRT